MSFSNSFAKPVRAQRYDNCTNAPRPRQLAGAACISPCPRLRAPRPSGLPTVARNSSEVPHNRATGLGSHSYRRIVQALRRSTEWDRYVANLIKCLHTQFAGLSGLWRAPKVSFERAFGVVRFTVSITCASTMCVRVFVCCCRS